MHEQFHSPQLEARGYTGTYQDIWKQWLEDQGFVGQINEAEMNWLGSQGFTGPLNQRWYDMYYASGLRGTLDDMGSKWIVPDDSAPAPAITVPPSAQTINEGEDVTFNVTVTGDVDTYEWQTQAPGGSWVAAGGNSASLILTNVQGSADGTLVRVRAGNLGSFSPYTTPVMLTVVSATGEGLIFDPVTTTELAAAGDKITYLSIVATALGSGTKTLVIKRATTGDVWADGTIVYQGTVEGEMPISNGEMTFGEVVTQTTALPADFGTGIAAWRITGAGGRYVQGPITLET